VDGASRVIVEASLGRLRGVVRRRVEDEQLLLYLAYPWACFSDPGTKAGLRLPFGKERVHEMLVDLGRVGGKPTESAPAPAFHGFSVEWLPLKEGAPRPGRPLPIAAPAAEAVPMQAEETWVPPMPVPVPQMAPQVQQTPEASSMPRGFCKCWLPEAIFASGQDLRELITGPDGAHFGHVLKKYPNVELKVEGQCSLAVPPAQRLHVSMSSADSEVFESAAADVLDLVETVCDMVGEELGLSEEQVEHLIQGIRAEKYFEAHGLRTPLPPAKRREEAAATPAEPAMIGLSAGAAPLAPITPGPQAVVEVPLSRPPVSKVAPGGEFEFVDDDVDAQPAGADGDADTEDDARTEASDCLSDITEDDNPKGQDPDL